MITKIKKKLSLNILWLVCSVPVITIGASTTAMYYVAMKDCRGEEVNTAKDFFKSFKQNFIQATILWVIIAAVGSVIGYFAVQAFAMTGNFSRLAEVAAAAVLIIYFYTIIYIFPILARYDNPILKTIRLGFAVASVNFGTTFIIILLWAFAAISVYIFHIILIFWLLIGNILIANYTAKNCTDIFSDVNNKQT